MDLNYKKAFGIGILSQFIGSALAALFYNFVYVQPSYINQGPYLEVFFTPGVTIAVIFSLYYYLKHKNEKDLSQLVFIVVVSVFFGMLEAAIFSAFIGSVFSHASFRNM